MSRSGILCTGNWIVDVVYDIPSWPAESDLALLSNKRLGIGGGAANVAFNLAALDVDYDVLPIGLLGQDGYGDTAVTLCRNEGLTVEYLQQLPDVSTAHTFVMNVPGGSRTFFYYAGANATLGLDNFTTNKLVELPSRIFYLGYLNLLPLLDNINNDGRTDAAILLSYARKAGMMTCVDLVSSHNPQYKDIVFGTLPEIDWLFLNEREASKATGVPILGDSDKMNMARSAQLLLQGGVQKGCILHTPEMSLWKTADEELWFDTVPLDKSKIISAVGAGDAFAAGVLHGLHESWSPHQCIQLGNQMAADCLQATTATGGTRKLCEMQDLNSQTNH